MSSVVGKLAQHVRDTLALATVGQSLGRRRQNRQRVNQETIQFLPTRRLRHTPVYY